VAPLDETVPHAALVQPTPETLHEMIVLGFELTTGVSVAM
jgi:hypothetical protein